MNRNKHDSAYDVVVLAAGDAASAVIALGEHYAKRRKGAEVGGA